MHVVARVWRDKNIVSYLVILQISSEFGERTHYLSAARSSYIVEEGKRIVLDDVGRLIGGRAN